MFAARTAWSLTPNRLAQALERLRHHGSAADLLDLTASNPTSVGLEFDSAAILGSLSQPAALEYHPQVRGLLSARQAVAGYYAQRGYATSLDPARIVLTSSTSEAYSFLFRLLCDPGDVVLAPAPSYPLFEYLASINDVRLQPYRLFYDDGWRLDLHTIEQQMTAATRAILLVHPNNPTGSYVRPAELAQLNRICAERQLALIADEVFLDYAHTGAPPFSFAANSGALTFTLSGLSKISALPQMKLAWMVASGPDAPVKAALERLELIADTYLSVATPVQLALPALLAQATNIQPQLMARIRQNLAELDHQLATQTLCTRLATEAGWYAVLRAPRLRSDEELALELLERCSVLAHPGHFYDFAAEGHLVLSLITPSAAFAEALGRILKWVAENS